ncbi:MAG: type 4a pilus biogenesis protein PilO [Geobacteraceae bacterium]|nr:type 4a pilus biogenesis protein PilO [Geobacteraceae bacterium]NTW81231.1 type 4a pilus biogenesis protein PilO [Geobacteraceae bacterium]
MKQYFFEIVRQKWRLLMVILFLLLFNITLGIVVSAYQLPSLINLQIKWSDLRHKASLSGQLDPTTLHQQGSADLEKLKASIPEKRQFARVLSDLLEAAASSAVEVGPLSYKPLQIKEEALLSYKLSFSVSGSYAAVKSCLADLQKNPELIVVDSVSFSNNDLYVENVVMDLHLTVYLREGA